MVQLTLLRTRSGAAELDVHLGALNMMTTGIADFTEKLKELRPMFAVHKGVFVQCFRNDSPHPIHDRNGERRGAGKLLIRPRGRTIKIGKFVGGFLGRRNEDAVHMHPRPAAAAAPFPMAPGTYLDCLELILVLDLSALADDLVTQAEDSLRADLDHFLDSRRISVEDRRGDWRLLTQPRAVLVSALDSWVREEFTQLQQRFLAAT